MISLCFCSATVLSSSNTFLSLMADADNILKITKQEFCLESIREMRRIRSRPAYLELLDCLVRSVVGRKVYVENRMTKPLSEWFTMTDEAFLLLCLESYVEKWNHTWARAVQRQQQGELAVVGDEVEEEPGTLGEARVPSAAGHRKDWSASMRLWLMSIETDR